MQKQDPDYTTLQLSTRSGVNNKISRLWPKFYLKIFHVYVDIVVYEIMHARRYRENVIVIYVITWIKNI